MPLVPAISSAARTARATSTATQDRNEESDPESTLAALGRSTVAGAGKVGNFIDLPGSMVRDTLGLLTGKGWKNANPFDQLLSPFSSENRLSGRDLTTHWGMTRPNNPDKWEAADFGGFGLEVALDPLTYLTFGTSALSKAGQAAKKAGLMDDFLRSAGRGATGIGYKAKEVRPRFQTLAEGVGKRKALTKFTIDDLIKHGGDDVFRRLETAATGMGTTVDALRGQKLGGVIGVNLPFKDPSFVLGTGGRVTDTITRGLDIAGDAVRYGHIPGTGYSPGQHAAALFGRGGNKGLVSRAGQEMAQEVTAAERKAISASMGEIGERLQVLSDDGVLDSVEGMNSFRLAVEGVGDASKFSPEVQEVIGWARNMTQKMGNNEINAGIDLGHLRDVIDYYVRYRTALDKPTSGFSRKLFPETHPSMKRRADTLRGFHLGTGGLINPASIDKNLGISGSYDRLKPTEISNEAFMKKWSKGNTNKLADFARQRGEPVVMNREFKDIARTFAGKSQGAGYAEAEKVLGAKFLDDMQAELQPLIDDFLANPDQSRGGVTKQFYGDVRRHIAKRAAEEGVPLTTERQIGGLAKHLSEIDPKYAEQGVPLFGNHPLEDLARRMEYSHRAVQTANMVQKMLVDSAMSPENAAQGSVQLSTVLKGTKYSRKFREDLAKQLGLVNESGAVDVKRLGERFIPVETAKNIRTLVKPFNAPEEVSQLVSGLDKFSNLFKTGVTSLHPSFHNRNFASGQIQNFLNGIFSWKSLRSANDMVRGREIKGAAKFPVFRGMRGKSGGALTDAEATQKVAELIFREGLTGKSQGVSLSNIDTAGQAVDELRQRMPGIVPRSSSVMGSIAKGIKGLLPDGYSPGQLWDAYSPINFRGVRTNKTLNKFGVAGEQSGEFIEEMNRIAPFIEQLRKGVDPTEAAQRVKDVQVDYSALTEFEAQVMRRAMPFYSFTRGVSGFFADELARRPGGSYGQAIRAQNTARGDKPGIPEYVQQTASIPIAGSPLESLLGSPPPGTDRYLTGLGLMHEDPLSFVGGPQDVLLETASRLNPAFKAPMEWMTGETFFQKGPMGGRELTDLDPTVGRLLTDLKLQEELPGGKAAPVGMGTIGYDAAQGVEFLLGNSPLARFLTTARQVSDTRKSKLVKAANALTGLKFSDITPAAREGNLREQLQAKILESGGTKYSKAYFRGKEEDLTPEQARYAEAMRMLDHLARQRKKSATAKALAQ